MDAWVLRRPDWGFPAGAFAAKPLLDLSADSGRLRAAYPFLVIPEGEFGARADSTRVRNAYTLKGMWRAVLDKGLVRVETPMRQATGEPRSPELLAHTPDGLRADFDRSESTMLRVRDEVSVTVTMGYVSVVVPWSLLSGEGGEPACDTPPS